MAKYTTVSNMLIMLPDVMSRTSATSAQLSHFIDRAEGYVDAYLARRYTLPLTDVPRVIETISTDLSIYTLLQRMAAFRGGAEESAWSISFKAAEKDLENIAKGRMELVSSAGVVAAGLTTPWSSQQDYLPTFTEDDQLNQTVDTDKLTDIRQDRQLNIDVFLK